MTDSETEIIDFDDKYGLMSKFQDIALNSGTQETLSANLTLLRNAAFNHLNFITYSSVYKQITI